MTLASWHICIKRQLANMVVYFSLYLYSWYGLSSTRPAQAWMVGHCISCETLSIGELWFRIHQTMWTHVKTFLNWWWQHMSLLLSWRSWVWNVLVMIPRLYCSPRNNWRNFYWALRCWKYLLLFFVLQAIQRGIHAAVTILLPFSATTCPTANVVTFCEHNRPKGTQHCSRLAHGTPK